jgi:Lar family restriction alleviation protein
MTQNTKDAGASLLPCPFCGGDVKLIQGFEPLDDSFFVDCQKCEMSGQIVSTKDAAIAAWNRRAPTAEQAEGVHTPYAYEIGERGRTQSLAYPEYLERYATKEERSLPRKALYAAPVAPTPAAQEWQPIETAPKTGRILLLGYPNVAGKWRTVRGQWMSEAYIAEYWEEPDDVEPGWFETSAEADDVPNCWPVTPTHWMPLPAAPASSTGDQEIGDA